MLSHDASLRKSEAASSNVAFSTSINWGEEERAHQSSSDSFSSLWWQWNRSEIHPCGLSVCHSDKRFCHYNSEYRSDAERGSTNFTDQKSTYRIKAGHAKARRSVFDVEKEEDVDEPHDAIKGTPTPGTSADVWLLGNEPERSSEPVEACRNRDTNAATLEVPHEPHLQTCHMMIPTHLLLHKPTS